MRASLEHGGPSLFAERHFLLRNPQHASCGSIRRRRTRPAEAASQLRAKQPDSLASSASTWCSTRHFG